MNISLKHLKYVVDRNVEIVPIAIGNKDGTEKLRIPKTREKDGLLMAPQLQR